MHVKTKNKLRVDLRVDRALLLSVYESSRQIYNLCVWDFGDLPDEPKQPSRIPIDNPVVQKAFECIKPTVIKYSQDEIKSAQEFKKLANETCATNRERKTPMGKIGLAKFLDSMGHPAPWAEATTEAEVPNGSKGSAKKTATKEKQTGKTSSTPPSSKVAMKAMKAMKVVPKKARNQGKEATQAAGVPTKAKQSPTKDAEENGLEIQDEAEEEDDLDGQPLEEEEANEEKKQDESEHTTDEEEKTPTKKQPSKDEPKKKRQRTAENAAKLLGVQNTVGLTDIARGRLVDIAAKLADSEDD